MSRTANLRRHHDAAMAIAGELLTFLDRTKPSSDEVREICQRMARLAGLLRIHFAAEDKSLYPALIACGDAEVASVAQSFEDEMGQVGPAFAVFFDRWSSPAMVREKWYRFAGEARELLGALSIRVTRETEVLYPMADRALANSLSTRAA